MLHIIGREIEWGTYGKNPVLNDLHIQWVKIKNLSNSHITAILQTQPHVVGKLRDVFINELEYRCRKGIYIIGVNRYPNIPLHKMH